MELVQHPHGDNKFITVKDLLELADACRSQELDPGRVIAADGIIGRGNALRGLRVKESKSA